MPATAEFSSDSEPEDTASVAASVDSMQFNPAVFDDDAPTDEEHNYFDSDNDDGPAGLGITV